MAAKKSGATSVVIWSAFGLCTATSVVFNGLHASQLDHSGLPVVIGAVWPIMAVLAVEVLTRIPWPRGKPWQVARFGGVGTVAVGAMTISYLHTFDVLLSWGESWVTAAVGPLVVDGLMTLSGAALLAMHTSKTPVRRKRPTSRRPARVVKAA